MHAIYSFLMELPTKLCVKDLKKTAASQFEVNFAPFCDEEQPEPGRPARIGSLYVQKWALGEAPSKRIQVTVQGVQ